MLYMEGLCALLRKEAAAGMMDVLTHYGGDQVTLYAEKLLSLKSPFNTHPNLYVTFAEKYTNLYLTGFCDVHTVFLLIVAACTQINF